jgi:uncharacterized sulfatase
MSSKKQIVLLMTDTQRWDMLGCYAQTGLKTPNLDRMASQGMMFERSYTCQPVCGPARSALFTGLFPHSNGSWANSMPLGANVKTVGNRLQDAGYQTAYIGKWHLDGGDYFGLGRAPDGWDPAYWYDMRNYLEELPEEDRYWSRRPEIMQQWYVSEDFTFAHRCSKKAIEFLSRFANDDFLLVVSYDEPHHPYVCPQPYASMYADYEFPKSENVWDNLDNKPEHQRVWSGKRMLADKNELKITHPYYFGCNSFVDHEIGRVLDAIDRYAPNALVIYTSDHGDMLDSHSLSNKGPFMYDEVTRIPLIVRWPSHIQPGTRSQNLVSHIQITPTILQVMGLETPRWMDGTSFLPVLLDPEVESNPTIFMEFSRYEIDHDPFCGFQPIRCAFDGRYKLVVNLLSSDELYDLENDPGEMVNLIKEAEYSSQRDRLHDQLLEWMDHTRDPFRGYYWERRSWRTDAPPPTFAHSGMTRQRENEEYEPRQLDYNTGLEIKEAVRPK